MNFDEMRSRHLVTSEKSELKPGFRIVGTAYYSVESDVYKMYLRLFAGIPYYVVKNWAGFPEYLIYSGHSVKDNGKSRYFNRIGSGFERTSEKLIEVVIPDLNQTYYINLDAADWRQLDAKKAA